MCVGSLFRSGGRKVIDEKRVLCVEMLLSKFFVGRETADAKEAMLFVRRMMQGEGVRKSEIREARQRLGIRSEKAIGEYLWSWESPVDPETMWKIKSKEFIACEKAK